MKRLEEEIAKRMLSAFEEHDKDIPEEDLRLLDEAFAKGEVGLGGAITLPNGRSYKCMAIGWKRLENL